MVKHEGDGVFAVFAEPAGALIAAAAFSRSLGETGSTGPSAPDALARPRVRIGIHTGDGQLTERGSDYVGIDVHYAARVAAAGERRADRDLGRHPRSESPIGPPDGTRLLAMGPRRLKDFDDPRPIHLLVIPGIADDERPLRTDRLPEQPARRRRPTSSVAGGRPRQASRRSWPDTRLLTLTGPGGTGKTRLGLELASSVAADYAAGTWFVDLAPIRDPELLQGTIAAALDVREEPGRPDRADPAGRTSSRSRSCSSSTIWSSFCRARPTTSRPCSGRRPGLRIIVTSREVLRVTGEHEYQVPPLDVEGGLRLFLDRARQVRAGRRDD